MSYACAICGSTSHRMSQINKLDMLTCDRCGVVRQNFGMTKFELDKFYEEYHKGTYTHTVEQDRQTAVARLRRYDLEAGASLLDFGSGNGAFVDEARNQGIDAVGCDVAVGASCTKYVYEQDLFDINFPTEHFDHVTVHDVLEHVLDPIAVLKEIFRILKPNGELILEIPDYHTNAGKKHWKQEHLWYWHKDQIRQTLRDVGYDDSLTIYAPIPGKTVLRASRQSQKRVSVLVPPGIGDIYWSLTKIQALSRRQGFGIPEVKICSLDPTKDRSIDYVRRHPFVKAGGYHSADRKDPIWHEAYLQDARTIFRDVHDCDYFVAYNGITRFGKAIDEVDTDLETNWFLPMWQSLEEKWAGEKLKEEIGPYTVAYFIPHGPYKRWLNDFDADRIYKTLEMIAKVMKHKIVLVGAKWDGTPLEKKFLELDKGNDILVSLVGKTTLDECFGIIRNCEGVIGYPSGITIMATAFRKPTLMLWNDYYNSRFYWNACPPQSHHNWYEAIDTKVAEENRVFNQYYELVNGRPIEEPSQSEKKGYSKRRAMEKAIASERERTDIICVLQESKDYNGEYVDKLHWMLKRTVKRPYRFMCLTDSSDVLSCDEQVPLLNGWKGMWSKIEIFRKDLKLKGSVVYTDLDVVLLGDITDATQGLQAQQFRSMAGWNIKRRTKLCSAMMAWSGQFAKVYTNLRERQDEVFSRKLEWWEEQDWIEDNLLKEYGVKPEFLQSIIPLLSYKHHCLDDNNHSVRPSDDVVAVCFHGTPRPRQASKQSQWVKECWR